MACFASTAAAQTTPPIVPISVSDPSFIGSYGTDVIEEDIEITIRKDQMFRNIATSPHDPNVAFVTSWNGYIFKTEDGGKTWNESRLIVNRMPFFGDGGQMLYFGRNRVVSSDGPLPAGGYPSPMGRGSRLFGGGGSSGGGGGAAAQGLGAALTNANFGIGLPGSAPRLQNVVRRFGKPTSGMNIKQTLFLRGSIEGEIRRVVVHPEDPNVVYACTFFGVFKSYDSGYGWIRVLAGSNPKENHCLYIAVDPLNTNRVFAGTENGMFYSENSGETFFKTAAQGVGEGDIAHILFNPHDPRYVFAGTHSGVLRSADGGHNWEFIYYTTFTPARLVRHVAIDYHDKTRGYVATFDGLFTTANILTASFESWERVSGLNFVGTQIRRVSSCPKHPGHLWLVQQIKLPSAKDAGLWDFGVTMIWESLDGGDHWKVINTGNSPGSNMWFETDLDDPDLLWICNSRSITKLRRVPGGLKQQAIDEEAVLQTEHEVLKDLPTVAEAHVANFRFKGVEYGLMLNYRSRALLKPLVPKISLSYTNWQLGGFNNLDDYLYISSLPYRQKTNADLGYDEFRIMLKWDLSDMIFNLERIFFGRVHRLNDDFRQRMAQAVFRMYGELKRLVLRMRVKPPDDVRTRVLYRIRIEELYSYLDFNTGGYLTRYQQGGQPSGWDTPWFQRWDGVDPNHFAHPPERWTATGFR